MAKEAFVEPAKILISGARAPVALHMARVLSAAGYQIHLTDSLHCPISITSKAHSDYHKIPQFRYEFDESKLALKQLLDQNRMDVVIPTRED